MSELYFVRIWQNHKLKSFQFRLRNANLLIKFVTNTTKESSNCLYKRLTNLGFDLRKEEIFSSLVASRKLIVSRQLNPMLLIDPAAIEDFQDLVKDETISNAVVVGLAPSKFNYDELNRAFRLVCISFFITYIKQV